MGQTVFIMPSVDEPYEASILSNDDEAILTLTVGDKSVLIEFYDMDRLQWFLELLSDFVGDMFEAGQRSGDFVEEI